MSPHLPPSLRRLAAMHGLAKSYRAMNGRSHRARPEVLLALLRTMGEDVESLDDVERALSFRLRARRRRPLEPVVVLWDDSSATVPITLPADEVARIDGALMFEDGTTREVDLRLEDAETLWERNGARRYRLALPSLPLGYHRLSVRVGTTDAETVLVRAPRRTFRRNVTAKRWGLVAPLYAMRSETSRGSGDFTDLTRFSELVASHGGGFTATLPFFAAFVDEPSPYSPVSRLFWNELYIDPRAAPEWSASFEARELFSGARVQEEIDALDAGPLVRHRALMAIKRPVLERLAADARRLRSEALTRFQSRFPLSLDYARFRAAAERLGRPWGEWPDQHRQGLIEEGDVDDALVQYHLYCQMTAEEQLTEASRAAAGSGAGLYLDLPLGVHRWGYDTWREATLFAQDADVGAPPDPVFTEGQSWGFPPIFPERSRLDGHRYLRLVFRRAMAEASILRIDHVMGLHRQFWIPKGFERREGVYVRYPAEELYAVLSLESHRARCEVVGENLGIVPEIVDRSLDRHGMRGIYLLQYSLTGDPDRPCTRPPARAAASLNTHDTPPFAGFCEGVDIEERRGRNLITAREASAELSERRARIRALDRLLGLGDDPGLRERLEAWLDLLFAGPSDLVAITLEDLWLERKPQNIPGTTNEYPNWRRRLRYRLDALPAEARAVLERLSRQLGNGRRERGSEVSEKKG